MLKRADELDPANAPQFRPESKLTTPNRGDIIVTESLPISPEKFARLPYGSPHPDFANNGLVLVWQGPIKASNNQIRVIRVYSNQTLGPQDWYNFAQEFSGDINESPIFIRTYTILRTDYAPLAKKSVFTGVFLVKVTNQGSNFTSTPTVNFSGPGTGAAATAIMSPPDDAGKMKVIGLELTNEGTGYTTAPTISFAGGGGTGAAAIAQVQPANAYLVKEKMTELQDPRLESLFVKVQRIYEVLPGPWIPFTRYDDDLGPIQGVQRAVLWDDPPQSASSDVGMKTTYEARDGSAIVAMEKVETWGRDPYQRKFEIESTDPTPEKFRADVPTTTESQIEPGRPEMPVLIPGELRRSSEEVNKFWRRQGVTRREPPSYPRELADYELGGVQTHGSEFGGTLETKHRLHNQPQNVEEGFDILASKVEALGRGLTWRRTTRLFTGGFGLGPYIELLTGGDSYVDDPAVIFSAGDAGSGAAGTASVTETPIAITDIDAGGVFPLTRVSNGDANGVFNFLGKRYNSGTWRNPAEAGTVTLSAETHPSYPVSQDKLNALVDRSTAAPFGVGVVPQPGGGHYIMIDLGPGRTLKCNQITFQNPVSVGGIIMTHARVYGFNKFGVAPNVIANSIALPSAASAWTNGAVDDSVGYRYFWIYGLDARISSSPELWPVLLLGEVELYGELTIAPEVDLGYSYNGDANGAFYYLGARGGSGTWRNPHTAGDIEITLPYDDLELGTLDSMVDREPSNTYLVNRNHSEIWFDLKEGRSLLLKTLTFRQRADYGSSMTQTAIQGSVDGVTWEESQYFNPSPTASAWTKVNITAFTKYYRFFRLIIPVGKSFHSIGELELYGSLRLAAAGSAEAPGYSVTGVQITDGGNNYRSAPRVVFSGGGPGTGAAGTAVINDGKVVRVDMTSAGGGYTSAPDVEFAVGDGGSGATADADIAGGAVTAINLLTGGGGYTTPPKVKIVSSTGVGASAHAILTGDVVTSIVLDSGGSGYLRKPVVVLYPESDPEADAEIGFDIDEITLVSGGEGYSSPPAVHIDGDGDTPARAVAVLGFPLSSVLVDEPGGGYTSNPGVAFAGDGTGAAGTAVRAFEIASTAVTAAGSGYVTEPVVQVTGGGGSDAQFQALIARMLLRIDMAAAGSGYTSDPTVVITGDGTGATAHVVRSFGIASIAVSAGGTGYTVAPTVTIPAPTGANGRQATAHAVLGGGAVTSIVIDDPGQGYLTAPTPTMTGGDGTGATIGAATLASGGAIDHIVLDTAGSNFSEPPVISFTGGAGSGAAASAILDTATAGGIAKVKILNPGKDYTSAPTLTILPGSSGGTGATATATLSTTGKIKSVTLTNPGSGYTTPPTVSFTGGGGSGASGKGVLAATGSVKSVTLIDPGDGFRAGGTVSFTGGGGSGASATITPSACGHVTKVTLTKPGGPFTVPPDVIFVGGQSSTCPSANKAFRPTGALSGTLANNNGGAHQTVVLNDGRVLATGGTGGLGVRAEIYDPDTEVWTPVADMPTARSGHCAIKLADGKVLVFGGGVSTFVPNLACYIYDPVADTWTATGSMVATGADDPAAAAGSSGFPLGPAIELAGTYTHAVVLDDGKIFCARGFREDNAVQIYDPVAGTWSVAARFELEWGANYGWITQRFTKLPDGNILATFGGWPTTLVGGLREARYAIYDTVADSWTYALVNGGGVGYQSLHAQILLDDGRVLVAAGQNFGDPGTPKTLLYDYLTDSWDVRDPDYPTTWYGRIPIKWPDGRIVLVGGQDSSGPGRGYTIFDPATNTFTFINSTLMAAEHDHTVAEYLPALGWIIVIGGSSLATCELLASVPTPATAAYRLGSSWPTLREEQTDPTEGIIILIDKTIVPPTTPLPAGYSEKFPLDIYRSIQIVSKVNLRSLPPPDVWDTTQSVSFPHLLLAIYPIWDTNRANATAGGLATGTQRGSVSASVQVIGSIVVTRLDGFRGAALATVERQFFFGPPPRELVPEPTIIRPSSGTAIVKTTRNSASRSGLTYSSTGNSNPAGNDFASYAKSSSSSGATTQVVDLHDVLSAGISSHSEFNASNQSFADALNVLVGAKGTFDVVLPASTPFVMEPGKTILAQVGVEKWRFRLYVRTLVRVTIPALP
jgi:hypothetical protein